jgi:enolase
MEAIPFLLSMSKIEKINAPEILDSRGNPAIMVNGHRLRGVCAL